MTHRFLVFLLVCSVLTACSTKTSPSSETPAPAEESESSQTGAAAETADEPASPLDARLLELVRSNYGTVDLAREDITDEQLEALVELEDFRGIERLNLSGIGDVGAATIANAPNLSQLTYLNLADNDIGAAGAEALANSPHLSNLAHLDLARNHIGSEGAASIANAPQWTDMTVLALERNGIGVAGATAIANSPHVASLSMLVLDHNEIGDEGAKALANFPHLADLEELYLRRNQIGDEGAKALSDSPHLAFCRVDLKYVVDRKRLGAHEVRHAHWPKHWPTGKDPVDELFEATDAFIEDSEGIESENVDETEE